MTICNVCGETLRTRDPSAFLCSAHEHLVPDHLMQAYREAVRDCTIYRKQAGGYVDPVDMPPDLVDAAVDAYYMARDVAITRARR